MTATADSRAITVAGSFGERQRVLANLYQQQRKKVPLIACLEREPDNPHDLNAIAVYMGLLDRTLSKVGYVPRFEAATLAPQMDAGIAVGIARARILRNWIRGYPVHELRLSLFTQTPERHTVYHEVNEVGF